MTRILAAGLQALVVVVALAALAFMLWEPHLEGRNVGASLFAIYFNDPFLAFAYVASISFFTVLYQAFRFLGFAARDHASTPMAINALRTLRLGAVAMIGFAIVGEVIIFLNESDDRAGGVFMGLLIISFALVAAVTATLIAHALQRRMDRPQTA